MATLAETETYEAGVYQLEITDPVIGGPDGIDNLQAKQLANRTNWLKAKIDSILGMSFIHSATAENPGDTDEFGYWDSLTLSIKKVTLANLKTVFFGSPALTGIPTAPTATVGTNTTQVATTMFATSQDLGVGQTPQNMTASRALGVTYTNTTGKPIVVEVFIITGAAGNMSINVNGIPSAQQGTTTLTGQGMGVWAIVPNGATYVCSASGTPTLNNWTELR